MAVRPTHLITADGRAFGPFMGQSVLGVLVMTPARYLDSARQITAI